MKNSQPILLSIPLLILGIAHYYFFAGTQDGCWSIGQSVYFMFSYLFGGLFALAASVYGLIKYSKEKQTIQLLPIGAAGILITVFIFTTKAIFPSNEQTQIFKMQTAEDSPEVFLFLNPGNECLLYTHTSQINCYFTGQYEVKNDTLRLQETMLSQQPNTLYSEYLIGRDSILRPILENADSTTWLFKTNMEALN